MPLLRSLAPKKSLDENWVHLMLVARSLGITKEEVRQFIQQTQKQNLELEANGS
jgi:hypothetical protein